MCSSALLQRYPSPSTIGLIPSWNMGARSSSNGIMTKQKSSSIDTLRFKYSWMFIYGPPSAIVETWTTRRTPTGVSPAYVETLLRIFHPSLELCGAD